MTRFLAATLLLASLTGTGAAAAASPETADLLRQAEGRYLAGDYAQAAGLYRTLVDRHPRSAALRYNLGNALYRQGETGRARLAYERARVLDPGDPDIAHNLELLRAAAGESGEDVLRTASESAARLAPVDALAAAASAAFFLLSAGAVAFLMTRRKAFALLSLASGLLLAPLGGWLFLAARSLDTSGRAVVIRGPLDVYNAPGRGASVGFTLPAGREVRILGEDDGWYAVGLPSEGLEGWAEKDGVAPVAPPGDPV